MTSRALGGEEGRGSTDKVLIVMMSYNDLKLKISPHHSFYSYRYFLKLTTSVHRMDFISIHMLRQTAFMPRQAR